MATTNKQLAVWAAEAMGLKQYCFLPNQESYRTPFGSDKFMSNLIVCRRPKDQHALAMLCVAEGVEVWYGHGRDVLAYVGNGESFVSCTRPKLVRTILAEYVKMKRGE